MNVVDIMRESVNGVQAKLGEHHPGVTIGPVVIVALMTDPNFIMPASSTPTDEVIAKLDTRERAAFAQTLYAIAGRFDPA